VKESGADGLLIEAHYNHKKAPVIGHQSFTSSDFARLMNYLKSIAEAVGINLQQINGLLLLIFRVVFEGNPYSCSVAGDLAILHMHV